MAAQTPKKLENYYLLPLPVTLTVTLTLTQKRNPNTLTPGAPTRIS